MLLVNCLTETGVDFWQTCAKRQTVSNEWRIRQELNIIHFMLSHPLFFGFSKPMNTGQALADWLPQRSTRPMHGRQHVRPLETSVPKTVVC